MKRFPILFLIAVFGLAVGCVPKSNQRQLWQSVKVDLQGRGVNGGLRDSLNSVEASAALKHIESVSFALDSYSLNSEAREILKANSEIIKRVPNAAITIQGHCDERGTTGYNIALGERRAIAVKNYYIWLGLKPEQIKTLSFGEEKLLCDEDSDACHRLNRRARTVSTMITTY